MPEYLFFRPPRRQPRLLVATSQANKLALIVSDPWELRCIAEHSIPLKNPDRMDRCQILIQEILIRERPQVLVVMASRSTARMAMRQFARHFDLPIIEMSPFRWQSFQRKMKSRPKTALATFFNALPERHVSKALFKNKRLLKTALLAHAALSHLLKTSYDAQPKIELDR